MTTSPELATPTPQIERDTWGRPMVVPPAGGNPVPYTRCTTFVGCIEDTWNLSRWQQRMVAIGLSERDDLRLSVIAHRDDKKQLDKLCEDAAEVAKAHAGATIGTALHTLTERLDRGMDLGVVPEAYAGDLRAYEEATADLKALHIEEFCVNDHLKIGGTPDRVVRFNGKRYIADLKTGSIDYGYVKIAAQLAVYAHSHLYDVRTHERSDHHAERDKGIIIHLPAGTGTCRLYWVDLATGWDAVRVARDVRAKRALKYREVVTDFGNVVEPVAEQPSLLDTPQGQVNTTTGELADTTTLLDQRPSLADQIKACRSRAEVEALWQANASIWTSELSTIAKLHLGSLGQQQ